MPSSPGFVLRTAVVVATLFAVDMMGSVARADAGLRVALFKTASEDANLQPLAAAVDPVLLSELGNVPELSVVARPALDLPSMQLAVDCVGETPQCLSVAAKQAQADGLVAPMVRRIGAEVVVTVLLHDTRKQTTITAATRRFGGDQVEQQVLDAVPGMVRELFGLKAPDDQTPSAAEPTVLAPAAPISTESSAAQPTAAHRPLPILPIVVGAVGVALLATGTVFGVAAKSSEDEYAKLKIGRGDTTAAAHAQDKYDSAASQATIANIGFGVGAAALAAGVVLLVLDLSSNHESEAAQASARMRVSSQLGRLTLAGAWD